MKNLLRIGTRGSQLALWQARWVQQAIEKQWPEITAELTIIKTTGDKITDVPLAKVGGKGLFVKEIEEALMDGRIDLAVHSMKDMPAELPHGLCISAVPERENPLDALISNNNISLDQLPRGNWSRDMLLLEINASRGFSRSGTALMHRPWGSSAGMSFML